MKTKIEEVGAEKEVLKLRESGLSYKKIAEYLRNNYPALHNVSFMAVKRFLEKAKTSSSLEKISQGIDPSHEIYEKFIKEMTKLAKRLDKYQSKYEKLLDEAFENRDLEAIKILGKRLKEDNDQIRKSLTSLIQWVNIEIEPVHKAKTINITQVNNLLLSFTSELCPKCRAKVRQKMEEILTI